jgi:hypothetical protein
MPANVDALLRTGIEAVRAGKKEEARRMFEKVIELDEQNEQAWIWMSAAVETKEDQIVCLENVLTINPNNDKAKQGLKALGVEYKPTPPAEELPHAPAFQLDDDDDLFKDVDFSGTGGNSFGWEGDIATSSASVTSSKAQATPDQYDDWVSGLGIKGGSNTKPPVDTSSTFKTYNEDDFISEPVAPSKPTTSSSSSLFDEDDPFSSSALSDDAFGSAPKSTKSSNAYESFGDDDPFKDTSGAFDDDPFANSTRFEDDDPFSPSTSSGGSTSRKQPRDEFDEQTNYADEDESFDELFDNAPTPQKTQNISMKKSEPMRDPLDDDPVEPSFYFAQIPVEIVPGRLPGTIEKHPMGLKIFLGLATVMFVSSFGFLILQVIT